MEMNNLDEQKLDGLDKSNPSLQANEQKDAGEANQSKSSKKFQFNELENVILKRSHDVGDFLERIGERVQLIGEAIYKIGNAIEHLNERMNDSSKTSGQNLGSQATPPPAPKSKDATVDLH